MDHGNESGGVYAAEKIIKKRYRKVNKNDENNLKKSISPNYTIDLAVNIESNTR